MDPALASSISRRRRRFAARGIAFALASGACYGLYTALLTLAQTQGVWGAWFSGAPWGDGHPALGAFTVTFVLAALAAGLNDLFSGAWSLLACARNGQIADLRATLCSRPGLVMVLCAVVGGPFATICYVVALNAATAAGNPGVIVPIAALNCAIGSVLGRILFRQGLEGHKLAGIAVCLAAGALIGGASFASMGPDALPACAFALLAAFGWGFEGCVAGFGSALVDYRIGIAIRQTAAGALELAVMFPALAAVSGDAVAAPELLGAALGSPALALFAASGLFAMPAYAFWYKGNSMCGTALGMACNSTYAFWGPLFIWLIMGVLGIGGMSESYPPLSAAQWIGAVVMVAGIFLIAAPRGRREGEAGAATVAGGNPGAATAADGHPGAATAADGHPGTAAGDPIAAEAGGPTATAAPTLPATAAPTLPGAAAATLPAPEAADGPARPHAGTGGRERGAQGPQPAARRGGRRRVPLYYAIILHFMDGDPHAARDVAAALGPAYGGRARLEARNMDEALATACENGLLDEADYRTDERGELEISYRVNDFGREMVERCLGPRKAGGAGRR